MNCWICQWRISSALDGGKPLGRWTRGHIERCDTCRRFWENSVRLEQQLRTESPVPAAPGGAVGRVIYLRPAFWLAAAAGIGVIALILALLFSGPKPSEPPSIAESPPQTPPGAPAVAERPRGEPLTALAARPDRLLMSLPEPGTAALARQLDDLASDARAAAGAMLAYLPNLSRTARQAATRRSPDG